MQVWQVIPANLSDVIESIQRRALRIVFPSLSYQQALNQANLPTLINRREFKLCKKLMTDMKRENHPISFLLLQSNTRSIPYNLTTIGSEKTITDTKRTKPSQDHKIFLHLKFFCVAIYFENMYIMILLLL